MIRPVPDQVAHQPDQWSDAECLIALQRGDREGLSLLYQRYHRLVFSIALRILRHADEAQEVVQAVFAEILQVAYRFDPNRGSVKVWVLQYAYHRSYNRQRYLNSRQSRDGGHPDPTVAQWTPTLWRGLTQNDCEDLLGKAMQSLTVNEDQALRKVFYEGCTIREAATEMSTTPENVRHYYYRGLEKLRRFLKAREAVKQ